MNTTRSNLPLNNILGMSLVAVNFAEANVMEQKTQARLPKWKYAAIIETLHAVINVSSRLHTELR